ncbi:STM3941 family protein [Staphylococcus hyicus]|uniref:STM3941 family protein n=1 Tax=Staphylococcus hyicus TaxID=1284 RepID=UPI002739E4DE|nr:STM3941 family protein [Staphylococcus hyicus]MDP4469085.1 STM3941 family protein [Staphylococcus hyicus]
MNHGESKVVHIEKAKGKQMMLLSLCIIMVLILLLIGLGASSTFLKIIMILCALFFALGIWFFTKSLLNKKGFAILDEHGFYEYSTAMSTNDTLIPWKEVKEINIKEFGAKRYVQVLLHHPEIADNARTAIGNMFAKSNAKIGYAGILIDTNTAKGMKTEELFDLMKDFHQKYAQVKVESDTPVQTMKTIDE